jgi:hypothetical protein
LYQHELPMIRIHLKSLNNVLSNSESTAELTDVVVSVFFFVTAREAAHCWESVIVVMEVLLLAAIVLMPGLMTEGTKGVVGGKSGVGFCCLGVRNREIKEEMSLCAT